MLYHATFEHNMESIKEHGLLPLVSFRNDSISNNVICFAQSQRIAISFLELCEFAEEHDDYDSLMNSIVILAVSIF